MTKQVYTAKDLQELLGVSKSKAYQYIRIMNQELSEKGFLTVRGKVPCAYVQERFFGMKAAGD
ncbi:MAG: helix-turn-helix domain-containing protein [Clostridiales bacterium]|nr:helix-turn-helix domain-containing protein [Clostridiales bacterium]